MGLSLFPNASQASLRVFSSIALLAILPAFTLTGSAQTGQYERSFPVSGKTKIIVINATKISISAWDKSEVAITAKADGVEVTDEEIRIEPKKNDLEIWCQPRTEKPTDIILRVPSLSALELKSDDYKIEIDKAVGVIKINASKDAIHLDVPESADLDLRGTKRVTRVLRNGESFKVFSSQGDTRLGHGPPFMKLSAKGSEVLLDNGPTTGFDSSTVLTVSSISLAAKTIAARNGLMGDALRRSHPELIRAASLKSAAPNENSNPAARVKEDNEEGLKLQTYLVNLNISVRDRDGKAISGLNQNDFSVFEENELQKVSFFSLEQAPFNLVLLIDLSGSVKYKLDLIKEAALHFLDVISPNDNVAVITFTTDVAVVSHLTNDREKLRESISKLQVPPEGTTFYDALAFVLVEELSKVKGQRNAVIAITDGQDNSLLPQSYSPAFQKRVAALGVNMPVRRVGSYLTFEQLLEGVLEADALVYPIHIKHEYPVKGTSMNSPSFLGNIRIGGQSAIRSPYTNRIAIEIAETGRKQLHDLASSSGGRFFSAERIEDLKEVYERVAADLRTVYSLAFNPKNQNFDGKFRRVRVKVARPEAAVRTRKGYYAQQ